jgi:5-methyltetrahydrofolate--homocysteine methyltransferase
MNNTTIFSVRQALDSLAQKKILILDGAMGTMIQRHQLTEADFRGTDFHQPFGRP